MEVMTKLYTENPGLAFRRLQAALSVWEHKKHSLGCHWLYVCARSQGKKLRALWISLVEDAMERIERELGDVLPNATSFELEMLHTPRARCLNPAIKDQWNSLRGKQAMLIDHGGKVSRWAATEMLARNLSFRNALNRHLAGIGPKNPMQAAIPVTFYQTKQLFCDNRPMTNGQAAPIDMFRGNWVVEVAAVTRDNVLCCAQAMTRWLAAQVNETGAAQYKYWPSRGAHAASNNAIRQWMATVCLNRAAKAFSSDRLAAIAKRNLARNLSTLFRCEGELGYIWMNGSAKLGAAALAALAIFESPQRKTYLSEEYALYALIQTLSNADGSFDTFYIPRERKDNQNFYSGEALLFLMARYRVSRHPDELARIMAAFRYYRDWHRDNRNPAFVPWHTQAYYLVWEVTMDESLKAFIFEMNDWLLSMQQWDSAEFPDMQGRFYDPARPHFGPPHASSTGVYLEGLIDAYALAKQCGDKQRAENYRVAIVRGIRSLMQLQFKDAVDCFYVKHVDRVLGGVRTTVYDNTIRIDNVQHALMALLKIYSRFEARDYHLDSSESRPAIPESGSISNVLVRTPKTEHPALWHREELLKVCSIVCVHNDKPWAAKSVIARKTHPDIGSVYFAKQSLSDELLALSDGACRPSVIIAELENARTLANKVACPVYEVASLLETARSLADAARARALAKIIGVTGSVGKTSIKDALAQLLTLQGHTHATEGNANDGWGVLDTLMNLPMDARYAVMEMGMLGAGSIKIKSERIKPHVGIITNIHDAHLAYHGDESSIALTKSGLFDGLAPQGVAVLPRDSAWYDFLKCKAEQAGVRQMITFGYHPQADFRLLQACGESNENIVHANTLGKPVEFLIGAAGPHWALNAMAILAAVHAADADVDGAIKAMAMIRPSFRRGEVHRVETDSKSYTVIDDSWNASPASVVAALKNMASIKFGEGGRKILFIGDMLQLGKDEIKKHIELRDAITSNGVDRVFAVGKLTHALFNGLPLALQGGHFPDAVAAAKMAREFVDDGDVILVKGSNAMEMWSVVKALRGVSNSKADAGSPLLRLNRERAAV